MMHSRTKANKENSAGVFSEHFQATLDASKCLYQPHAITRAITNMTTDITTALRHVNPLILCVIRGSIPLVSQLLLHLDFPLEVDYLSVDETTEQHRLHYGVFPRNSLRGRTLVVVNSLFDRALMREIIAHCQQHGASCVLSAVLAKKKRRRFYPRYKQPDFAGVEIATHDMIYGYGIAYKGYFRNVPGIYQMPKDINGQINPVSL